MDRVILRGVSPNLGSCTPVSGAGLKALLSRKAVTQCIQFHTTDSLLYPI